MSIIIPLLDQAIKLSREEEYLGKKKTTFWASESETMSFDIFHRFMGTEPTNPMTEEKMMMLRMRKLTEEAVIEYLKKSGNLIPKLTNDERCFFEWGKNKVPISGYPDAGIISGKEKIIIEVKTYYGGKQHSEISNGKIKTSYLKQLAIYLYHFKIKHGILLLINQGTGERFEYELYQESKNKYHYICPDNTVEINLEEVFKRFEKIWVENIVPKKEPEIEFTYKYDIEKINWEETAASAISKARNNHAVIGDWQIKYSDFKDLIIKRQGTVAGYTPKEINRIKELTAGYSTKKSNQVRFDPSDLE
ncbi:MAG: hypothetical protein WCX46_04275 [Candidatus Paceibacterota bacterium]